MVDFFQIELSKSEFKLLEQIESKKAVFRSNVPDTIFLRLEPLKILTSSKATFTDSDGSERPEVFVEFGDNGRNFLYFYRNKLKEKRTLSRRYIITTTIAVAALILAIISLLWQAYTWKIDRNPNPSAATQSIERPAQPEQLQGLR